MLTSKNLVAFALIAIASTVFLSAGCSREEEAREASGAAAGEVSPSRMDDPEYVAQLDDSVNARKQLLATRERLAAQMASAEGAEKASLQARIDDLNKALEDERGRAMAVVRQRIMSDEQKGSSAQ